MILERAGYRVVTAAEPQQALAKMAEEKPDLVITDLMMTSLDSGFSFARTIKEDPRYADVPVIISTSVSSAMGLDFRPRSAEETGADERGRLLRQAARCRPSCSPRSASCWRRGVGERRRAAARRTGDAAAPRGGAAPAEVG